MFGRTSTIDQGAEILRLSSDNEALTRARAQLQAEIERLSARSESLERENASMRAERDAVGASLIAAQHSAQELVAGARAEADRIMAGARTEADKAIELANADVERARTEAGRAKGEIQGNLERARDTLVLLVRAADEALAALEAVPVAQPEDMAAPAPATPADETVRLPARDPIIHVKDDPDRL